MSPGKNSPRSRPKTTSATLIARSCLIALLSLVAAVSAAAGTDCSVTGIETARREFRTYYDAKDFAKARDTLRPFERDCFGEDPQSVLAASVLSDLAIAAHHTGDDDICIEALEPYAPGSSGSERRLSGLPDELKKAILFNLGRCTGAAAISSTPPVRRSAQAWRCTSSPRVVAASGLNISPCVRRPRAAR